MKAVVALVGRPNVGKSTLFNRITKSRQALVDDMPGVTRDRHYADAQWDDKAFTLVDTGGFLSADDDYFASQIKEQLSRAVEEADILVFILDGRAGLSPYDRDLADFLRRTEKPVFYLVNKVESLYRQEDELGEFYTLGMDRFYKVSAEHGLGVGDFLSDLVALLPNLQTASKELATKLTLGQISVDDLDKEVEKLEELGLSELVDIYQARYERYLANMPS